VVNIGSKHGFTAVKSGNGKFLQNFPSRAKSNDFVDNQKPLTTDHKPTGHGFKSRWGHFPLKETLKNQIAFF